MDVDRFVPGHGFIEEPKASREELVEYQKALQYVIAEVQRLHKLGLSADDAREAGELGPVQGVDAGRPAGHHRHPQDLRRDRREAAIVRMRSATCEVRAKCDVRSAYEVTVGR